MNERPSVGPSIEQSVPGDYSLPRPKPGAPNVVLIVLDDLGFGQLGCFGSDIATPHIDRLAGDGLRYNHFHVTALCSPTRACLLTGRNHHAVGMGFLTDLPMAFPGYTGRIPKSAVPLPAAAPRRRVQHDGRRQVAPGAGRRAVVAQDRSTGGRSASGSSATTGSCRATPTTGRRTSCATTTTSSRLAPPAEGYHLTEDLADNAIRYVHQPAAGRTRPPVLPVLRTRRGARAASRRARVGRAVPRRVRRRLGAVARRGVRAAARARASSPTGTTLSARPSWIAEWDDAPTDARRMLARQQEVFAGFLTHTDAQIGRVMSALEQLGVLDDTIVMLVSDNGASGEGGALGTLQRAPLHRACARDGRGQPRVARRARRHPLVPALLVGMGVGGQHAAAALEALHLARRHAHATHRPLAVRASRPRARSASQFVHAIDVMPTMLDACGVDAPDVVDGVTQQPVDGATIRATFDDPDAPDPRTVQYFEMLGLAFDRRRRLEGHHRSRLQGSGRRRGACSRAAGTFADDHLVAVPA